MERTLLSVKELAIALGISEISVRRACRNRTIPYERVCRMLRFISTRSGGPCGSWGSGPR